MTLRILSLNTWGGSRHGALIPYLRYAEADVLCLQEVTHAAAASAEWLHYRDKDLDLPQRANLFAEISAALPDHAGYFLPASRGELDDGHATVRCEFGLATFVRKSLPVMAQAAGFVHGEFSPHSWGAHPRPRNAHCLRIYSYADDFTVTVAHMHGLRDLAGKGDTPARHAQAEALVKIIETVRQGDERLVLCGDFNVLPTSTTFGILGRLGLRDLVTSRGHTDTRTSLYAKLERFADYMLVTPNVTVAAFDVVKEPEVSDHRALLLEIA